jgi:hypothetical protein
MEAGETSRKHRGLRWLDPRRPVPNLFIVGAVKAGTTSLHAYLAGHPDVFMSALKEPHFFASFELSPEFDNFMPVIRDADAYQALFSGSENFKIVGEASPSYLCDDDAAMRIKAAVPDARIIISLRNPVQRAYSHYLMEFRQGRESRPFAEALEADAKREKKGWGVSFQYLEQGLYTEQVKRYIDTFGSARVKVVLFEELTQNTAEVMRDVAVFLNIDPTKFPEAVFAKAHNPFEASRGKLSRFLLRSKPIRTWSRRLVPQFARTAVRNAFLFTRGTKPNMGDATRIWLSNYFEADLERLEGLLDRDLRVLRENG